MSLEEVLTFVGEYLPLNTLLSCRLLSKKSRTGVNSVLAKNSSSPPTFFKLPYSLRSSDKRQALLLLSGTWLLNSRSYFLEDFEKVKRFLTHFKNADPNFSNPFLTRHVSIHTTTLEFLSSMSCKEMKSFDFEKMLSLFGHNLHSITFQIGTVYMEGPALALESLLKHTPNLKILEVVEGGHTWCKAEVRYWKTLQLPPLPHLICVNLEGYHFSDWDKDEPTFILPFVKAYSSSQSQLKSFVFVYNQEAKSHDNDYVPIPYFLLPQKGQFRFSNKCMGELDLMAKMDWPLEELQLDLHHLPFSNEKCVSDVVRVVNHFSKTLSKLHLLFLFPHEFIDVFDNAELWQDFPKLREISTLLSNHVWDWFWNHLVKMKCQNIQNIVFHSSQKEEDAFHAGDLRTMAKQGLELIPNLKEIIVIRRRAGNLVFGREIL